MAANYSCFSRPRVLGTEVSKNQSSPPIGDFWGFMSVLHMSTSSSKDLHAVRAGHHKGNRLQVVGRTPVAKTVEGILHRTLSERLEPQFPSG